MRTAIRLTAAVGVLGILTTLMAGCAPSAAPTVQSLPHPSAATPSPTPTPSVDTTGHGTPLGYSCDELIDPDKIEVLDSHLRVRATFTPPATSSADHAVKIHGTACEWIDRNTGTSLVVSAAHPDAPTLIDLTAHTASYAARTSAFGGAPDVVGYYSGQQMEAYTDGGFWITASSPLFTDPIKAQGIMHAVLEALPN